MHYERAQLATLLARLDEAPRTLIIVTGPRQAGKTTLVRQALAKLDRPALYIAVDEPEPGAASVAPDFAAGSALDDDACPGAAARDARWLVRQWERARADADRSERGAVPILDEIQKIPLWSDTVKGLWDADRFCDRRLHVVLLGSSPLAIGEGMSESMAGRFQIIRLAQWSFGEMAAAFDFDLERYVFFGGYPGAAPLAREQDTWREYIKEAIVASNIGRDLLADRRVEKPALPRQLFELSADRSAQILSWNKILGQLQDKGAATTLAMYLDMLEKAGLVVGIPRYMAGARPRRASSPKLNILDTALMSALSDYTFEEAMADRTFRGRLVESAVGAHLYNTANGRARLGYWRANGHEVDFVLARGSALAAFEIESGVRRRSVSGLDEFARRFPHARRAIAGQGGVPLSEFLTTPALEWVA